MPPATTQSSYRADDMAYPSRTIAFQAAGMITSIIENLQAHGELRFTPAFIVYSLFSALIMHVYQMRSSVPSVVAASQERINVCMNALKEVSKVWLVAKMVHTLFESILGNKVLEERLQKAAGKRHQKSKPNIVHIGRKEDQPKRKYDEMDINFPGGPPAAQVSYERSRPQTPAVTPSRDLPPGSGQNVAPPQSSPNLRQASENFMTGGNSRGNTRPTSPFNVGYSVPATPPDLFLVTRNSPPISQSLWENFQPDQLFPDGTNISMPPFSPTNNSVDPQLQMPQQMQGMQQPIMQGQQPMPQWGMRGSQDSTGGMQAMPQNLGVPQMNMGMQNQTWPVQAFDARMGGMDSQSQDDSWSNSSRGQGVVPTTLNVEDWFQFFGINGDMNGINVDSM